MRRQRIELLDGFRFLAVLSVLLYHYTFRWAFAMPYGHFFGQVFQFGYLGVQFFFIISGFVISYTLEDTDSPASFIRNRFSRLFPPMLLCSLITFCLIRGIDSEHFFPHSRQAKNFLPSLTFISPSLWSACTGKDFAWINGSYWSLWTEVQFYVFAGALYFLNKRRFLRNILIGGLFLCALKYVPWMITRVSGDTTHARAGLAFQWRYACEMFNITYYILWFLAGVVAYELYKSIRNKRPALYPHWILAIGVFVALLTEVLIFYTDPQALPAFLVMMALFGCLIYRPALLRFLGSRVLTRIGLISYSMYLIHENAGALLIRKYGALLGHWSSCAVPIMIMLVIIFAELSYRYYERKAGRLIKKYSSF